MSFPSPLAPFDSPSIFIFSRQKNSFISFPCPPPFNSSSIHISYLVFSFLLSLSPWCRPSWPQRSPWPSRARCRCRRRGTLSSSLSTAEGPSRTQPSPEQNKKKKQANRRGKQKKKGKDEQTEGPKENKKQPTERNNTPTNRTKNFNQPVRREILPTKQT